jgi:hypothetical protein
MSHSDKARRSWGAEAPDWVLALGAACDGTSQNKVAQSLGVSASLVSGVLSASYGGDMARIEDLVRGTYMREQLDCPVLGSIGKQVCRKWRGKASVFSGANALNITMYRACNRCPLHRKEVDDATQ